MYYRLRLAAMCATTVLFGAVAGLLLGIIFFAPLMCAMLGMLLGIAYWSFARWAADRFVLDAYDAQVVQASTSPNLYKAVAKLATDAGIEPPLIYSISYGPPIAFVVARSERSSVIVFSNALMSSLDQEEVRAILALMVSRIAQSDAAVCSVASTLAGIPFYCVCHPSFRGWIRGRMKVDPATGLTGLEKLLISISTPLGTVLLRQAFDATLMTHADAGAVRLTGSTAALASALGKIDRTRQIEWWGNTAYNPATAVLFAVCPLADADALPSRHPFLVKSQSAFAAPIPSVEERLTQLMCGSEQPGGTTVPA